METGTATHGSNLYVCFNDSGRNPTYSSAEDAFLCISDVDPNEQNPCGSDAHGAMFAPMIPETEADIRAFAQMFGWSVKVKAGRIMLMTDIPVEK